MNGGPVWSDLSSIVQLGAGLNFAYASLELFVERPFADLRARTDRLLSSVRDSVKSGSPSAPVRPELYSSLKTRVEIVGALVAFVSRCNPYFATLSGLYGTALLVHIARAGTEPVSDGAMILAVLLCFAWFGLALMLMTGCRAVLDTAPEV